MLLLQRLLQTSPHLNPERDEGHIGHNSYLTKLRTGVRVNARTGNNLSRMLADKRIENSMADGAHDDSVIVEVGSEADAAVVEKWRQGDASLYTADKLQQRRLLRHEPTVVTVLQSFWEAALRSVQSDGDATASALHKVGYAIMMDRVYRALIETFDPDDAAKSIETDWAKDTRGAEAMSRGTFFDVCITPHPDLPARPLL